MKGNREGTKAGRQGGTKGESGAGGFSAGDVAHMRRAMALAGRGRGRVEPNPMVGCVLARGSRAISEGFHRRFGGPHAEVEALRSADESVRGATAYVTLEPCDHDGKTPPCTEALIASGIRQVVVAMKDPGAEVAGRGFRRLRAAGIDVRVGCLRREARALNAAYLTLVEQGRPRVLLKWAQSFDGRLTTPEGVSRRISGAAADRWVHRLRGRVDGIMIGVRTALADDPRLTARGVAVRRVATRIVLDSHLRTDPNCKLVRSAGRIPTLIMTTRAALTECGVRAERLLDRHVRIEGCRARGGRVDLSDALRRLGAMGMSNVMVEGGATVLRELLARELADEAFVIVAPRLVGGKSDPVFVLPQRATNTVVTTEPLAPDLLYHLRFTR